MPKAKIAYLCTECGAYSIKWAGQCPECSVWNTLTETTIAVPKATSGATSKTLDDLPGDIEYRHTTGFGEFDRVLGGGLVPGAVVLLGGDPGVGKSTLLQQVSAQLMQDVPVLYATGEESLRQIGQRSKRLGLDATAMNLLADTSIENVLERTPVASTKYSVASLIPSNMTSNPPSIPDSIVRRWKDCSDSGFVKIDASVASKPPRVVVTI